MSLTPDDIQKFIAKKWINKACPRCEDETWQAGDPDDFKGLVSLGDDETDAIGLVGQHFIPVYWVVCTNCGHLEWIAAKIVREWKGENV